MHIETKLSTVGQLHAQAIREYIAIAATFVANHAEFALGAATGYARGFFRGLFGLRTLGRNRSREGR